MNFLWVRWQISFFVFFVSALGISFCGIEVWGGSSQEVKIGALLPLTGDSQQKGKDISAALTIAQEHMDYYLEKNGMSLTLDIRDTKADPDTALAELKDLQQQGIRVVIGPLFSSVAEYLMDFANENDMLLLSPSSTAISLALSDNLFRLCPNDTNQGNALALLMSNQDITNVIVVYVDTNYGNSLFSSFSDAFEEKGGTVQKGISFELNTEDFSEVIQQMESAASIYSTTEEEASAVFFIDQSSHAINLLNSISTESTLADMQWYCSEGVFDDIDLDADSTARAFAAQTQLSAFTFSVDDTYFYVYAHRIMDEISSSVGHSPSTIVLMAWDSLWLAMETYRLAPSADFADWKEKFIEVAENTFSAYGFCELDENGDRVLARYALYQYENSDDGEYDWNFAGSYCDEIYASPYISLNRDLVSPADATATAFTVGALLPLTGELASRGKIAQSAINLAKEHINTYLKNHKSGLRFDIAVEDTQSDPTVTLAAAQDLYDQGVRLFVGPLSSTALAGLVDYASDTGISIISPTSSAPSLALDDHIMRLVTNDKHQINGISRFCEVKGIDKVFFVYRDDSYGDSVARVFSSTFADRLVASFTYDPANPDFSSLLASLDEAVEEILAGVETDRVAVVTYGYEEIIDLLEQIPTDSVLMDIQWFGNDALAQNSELIANQAAAAISSQIDLTCAIYDFAGYSLFLPQLESMNSYLYEETGEPVSIYSVNTYDAIWLAALAYLHAGTDADTDSLWNQLENTANWTYGMSTPTFLDAYADRATASYAFYRVQENEANEYEWDLAGLYRNTGFSDSDIVIYEGNKIITTVGNWEIFQ